MALPWPKNYGFETSTNVFNEIGTAQFLMVSTPLQASPALISGSGKEAGVPLESFIR